MRMENTYIRSVNPNPNIMTKLKNLMTLGLLIFVPSIILGQTPKNAASTLKLI